MCTELLLRTADLPTKTTWEKGKGEPTTLSTTGGDMQLSREVRWATTGRVAAPSIAYTMVVNAYSKAAIINEGNDISEEPIRQR